ncbi:MAG: hypothetical protein LBD23_09070 [Oscillospiraceae bacterium]|jgi:hypothetical protein|nr:hypothetical protein [Oscillospiraceae bacterium]
MHDGHSHTHSHDHSHDNGHSHDQEKTSGISPKDIALLKYMLEHNKQHADELSATGSKIEATGMTDAANKIKAAVSHFSHANDELEKAIGIIEEGD